MRSRLPGLPREGEISSSLGYEFLCSYNWVAGKEQAIYVPGRLVGRLSDSGSNRTS